MRQTLIFCVILTCFIQLSIASEWLGPEPGLSQAGNNGNVLTLENNVISASWELDGNHLRPLGIENKMSGKSWSQQGKSLFQISTVSSEVRDSEWLYLGIQVNGNSVDAVVSYDGSSWTIVKTFPRTDFPGEPAYLRVGKMNLSASLGDYPSQGTMGDSYYRELGISEGSSAPVPKSFTASGWSEKLSNASGTDIIRSADLMTVHAYANTATFLQRSVAQTVTFVQCKISKGTDQAMSWSPGIALIWDDGKFLLINRRTSGYQFDVTTEAGETILDKQPDNYPQFNITSEDFLVLGAPVITDTGSGKQIEVDLQHTSLPIKVNWHARLPNGANYLREIIDFEPNGGSTEMTGLELINRNISGLEQIGTVPGSPVAGEGMFFGIELPVATNIVNSSGFQSGFACQLNLEGSNSYSFSTVSGVYAEGQMRRSFLYYLERERATPYHSFLHYNCWYDLGLNPTESSLLNVFSEYKTNLIDKHGVELDSFVVDDGWDDYNAGLWVVNESKFPNGFGPLKTALDQIPSHLGIWISPLGGYGGASQRTAHAKAMGLITDEFDLSEPAYYNWYRDKCLSLMNDYGVNYFKWDRAGSGVSPHFMALMRLASELKIANPDVFINVTVGTWPSPYWLNHVDSVWRGGADVGWTGKGDNRERWLTYRDMECYNRVVKAAPLFPLNSLMHHGIVHGRHFQGATVAQAGSDLKNEARSYFAAGPNLQELYLTPELMNDSAWQQVAEAALWYKENESVMADTHWVGGDPGQLEVYGWASWSREKAVLALRNPDDQLKSVQIKLSDFFELPSDVPLRYVLESPYADQRVQQLNAGVDEVHELTLEPFEVLVFDWASQTCADETNIPFDYNNDCQVNVEDFAVFAAAWLNSNIVNP